MFEVTVMSVGVMCVMFATFYRVFTFSDDEEEEKRVVRSQKDKRYGTDFCSFHLVP